jgi:lauroyl/myristoyl acyltransferase
MELQSVINSRLGVGIAFGLGRSLPPDLGYPVARALARLVAARRNARQVRAARANQWVVSGEKASREELDRRTLEVFQHSGYCIYEFYHYMYNPNAVLEKMELTPRAWAIVRQSAAGKRGAVLVGPHISNFDLGLRALALSGLRAQVLSLPQPSGGYRWQNSMRAAYGLDITPMSISALGQATRRLSEGGTVLTGVDRPVASQKYRVTFFGRKAALPVAYVQMALKTHSPVYVVWAHLREDRMYLIDASEPIEMQPMKDRQEEIVQNAEVVLQVVEKCIRLTPQQWLMFYPVWPETLESVP